MLAIADMQASGTGAYLVSPFFLILVVIGIGDRSSGVLH